MSGYLANTGYQFFIQNYDGSITNFQGYLANSVSTSSGFLLFSGNNNSGQIGNGTTINYSSPIFVGTLSNWAYIKPGFDHSSAIKSDGTLWSWGGNYYGQLGLGNGSTSISFNIFPTSSPVQVAGGSNWSTANISTQQIVNDSTSSFFAAYIKNDGTLWTWAQNNYGQLGNGTTLNYSSPIQIGSLTNWKQVSMGRGISAVKTDGTLWSWGENTFGALGNGTTIHYSSPIQIGALTNWNQVAVFGFLGGAAIKTDGTLWTWGYNGSGQLGNGTRTNHSSPIQVGSLTNWSQVSCGYYHLAAVKTNGTLWSCGYNNNGQLGNGTTNDYSSPIQIGSLTTWSRVSCGRYITAAIKTDGTLWAWGKNQFGEIGNGTTISYSSPIQIGLLNTWRQISFGSEHTVAVKTDSTLWTWGRNYYGQLGNQTKINYSSPIQIGSLTNWNQIFGTAFTTYTTDSSGNIYSFGGNTQGQLGAQAPGLDNYSSPIQIGSLTTWSKVSSAYWHTAAIKTDGTLWAWGYNNDGNLGNGTAIDYSSPIQIGALTTWSSVYSLNTNRTFAIKTDGKLWGWGDNTYGKLGNGTTIKYSSPIQIGALTNWNQIAGSYQGTVGITTDGKMWSWGVNNNGSIGQGAGFTTLSNPTQIGTDTNWSKLAYGDSHLVAIKTNGTLWACGYNYYGQCGNGTTTNPATPIQIGSLTNWAQVTCGSQHTAAIKTDGTLWTWGYNGSGQLNNGTTISYSSPIQIGSLTNWISIDSFSSSDITAAIGNYYYFSGIINPKVDMADMFVGKDSWYNAGLWGWGSNTYGQLGDGTTTNYSSPIQVGSLTNWKQVSTANHTAAIKTDGTLWTWGRNIRFANPTWAFSGQLGFGSAGGTHDYYSSPVQVGALTNWKQVSVNGDFTTAVKTDGTLWSWGYNINGQLGNGTTAYYSSPVQVGALTNWKQVSVDGYGSGAVKTDGTLWTWGSNQRGQLGYEVGVFGTTDVSSPVQVAGGATWANTDPDTQILNYSISKNGDQSVHFIASNGTLWACGINDVGQLGTSNRTYFSSPVQVGSLTNWKQIGSGARHLLALKTDGTLWTSGYNFYGQLGRGNRIDYSSPVQVGSLTNWSQVSAGYYFSAAIKTDGTLWVWGDNGNGQLGNETITSYSSPIQVGSLTTWSKVSAGGDFWVAIKTDGTLWSSGYNGFGELGTGSNNNKYSSPVQIGSLTTWSKVSAGANHTAAIKTDGTLWTWGYGAQGGQLGNGTTTNYSSPIQIGSLTTWKQVSCGSYYTSAIKTDGTLWTWGEGAFGKLGNGTTAYYSSPIQVGSLTNWSQVFCGYRTTYAYTTNSAIYSWGRNNFGQLGAPSTLLGNVSSPIQVGALTNWKYLSFGNRCWAAIKADGTLWMCGYGRYGRFGNGTTIDYSSPIQVGSLTNWKQVSAGTTHTAAIKTDGTLWTWGENIRGQLGDGTTIDYSSPIQVGLLTNWKQVSAGSAWMSAIKTDGTLWTWGISSGGVLGNGTTLQYSSPIQVGSLTNWKQVDLSFAIQAPDLELAKYVPGPPTGLSI